MTRLATSKPVVSWSNNLKIKYPLQTNPNSQVNLGYLTHYPTRTDNEIDNDLNY